MAKRISAPKTRNAGTLTESAFWSMVRSGLRRQFRFWKPIVEAKHKARRPNESTNKRLKWQFQCAHCKQWFPDKQIEVHHIIPCGSLRCYEDLPQFVKNLTAEGTDSYAVLCIDCHQAVTNLEREQKHEHNNS